MNSKIGKTACYTILKNERHYIDKWLYYSQWYDYRVLLDTGSTDGSYEYLLEKAKTDSGLIVEQKIFTPWRFDVARNYNHQMIPDDVEWCLSPDLDEYYSKNTRQEMERIIENNPKVSCIASDRLDIYSDIVRVGPPHLLPTNKIFRKKDYKWVQPIYEHISWIHSDRFENEIYSDSIYLIHDQDYNKKERTELYIKMLIEEYEANPRNTWCSWFLLYHYYKSSNINKFVEVGCDFIKYHEQRTDSKYIEILKELTNIFLYSDIDLNYKNMIKQNLEGKTL